MHRNVLGIYKYLFLRGGSGGSALLRYNLHQHLILNIIIIFSKAQLREWQICYFTFFFLLNLFWMSFHISRSGFTLSF